MIYANDEVTRIHDGYHAKAGICKDGSWFAAIMQLRDVDRDCITMDPEGTDRQRKLLPGKSIEDWIEGCLDDPVTVSLLVDGEDTPQPLTNGLKVYPPTVPVERVETPVVVWCEADDDDGFLLQIHSEGAPRTLRKNSRIFANPSVSIHDEMPFVSYQTHRDDLSIVTEICNSAGDIIHISPGSSPIIRSTSRGFLLVNEGCADGKIELQLVHLQTDGTPLFETTLNGYDDFNTHADVTIVGETAYVVWEASPAWGSEHYLGQHRNLACAHVALGGSPGVVSIEQLPIPKQVFRESERRVFNLPPVYPSFIDRDEGITVAYRRFRPDRVRSTGWDLFVIQKSDGPWSAPRRITKQYGNHDGGYTVLCRDNQFVSFFPAIINEGDSMPNSDYWLEIDTFDAQRDLGDFQAPHTWEGDYLVPPPTRHPVLAHTPVEPTISGLELIFGDMHRHSSAGRCMCARDGSAQEGIRFCRDILKNDILLLTDHHHHFSYADGAWNSLVLEQEAAGRIIQYGTEPGCGPGNETDFYASTREEWETLRCCVLLHFKREDIYAELRKVFPPDGVPALRHYHGPNFISEENQESYDPRHDIAMEALQCRGSLMVRGDYVENKRNYLFPTDFLNRGAKIALTGGTDHSGHSSTPNRFGMTGFWATDTSAEGMWDAIRKRRTYAVSNGKMAIWAECSGRPMGSEVSVPQARFDVQLSAGRPLRRIGLIRDGDILFWNELSGNEWEGVIEDDSAPAGEHWYTIVVQGESVYTMGKACHLDEFKQSWCMAFCSPLFLEVIGEDA